MSTPEQPAPYSIYFRPLPEVVVPGKRLGRHVRRDSRSLAYPYQARRAPRDLSDQLWARHIPILDQGDLGSCTGNAETGNLGCDPFYSTLPAGTELNEDFAVGLYSLATKLDSYQGTYPPDDTGSDGTSVAKAAQQDSLISGYTHAADVNAMADALQNGPVIVGVSWYSSFDNPDKDTGLIKISKSAYVRGGHEFVVRGVKIADELFLADNSWGEGFGLNGSMEFSWDTMAALFADEGDCTVSTPLTAPAPTPVPVTDPSHLLWFGGDGMNEYGGLQEWCRHHRTREDLAALKHDALAWAKAMGYPQ